MKGPGDPLRQHPIRRVTQARALALQWALFLFGPLPLLLLQPGCSGGNGGGDNNPTGPQTFDVTVNITVQGAGNGHGQVTGGQVSCSIQAGQASGPNCQGSHTMNSGTLPGTVTLAASPGQASDFVSWGGACSGSGASNTCQLSINATSKTQSFTVSAHFDLQPSAIQVTTTTVGAELDPDGYSLFIGSTDKGAIAASETKTYSGLASGTHSVELKGIADNCSVDGTNPRDISVDPGATAQTTFNVTCVPTTGSIEVTTITAGNAEDLDPNGYTLTITAQGAGAPDQPGPSAAEPGPPAEVGTNETETHSQLTPGSYSVLLGDIADNCSLDSGENPRTLSVVAGQTTQTTFNLTCIPPAGSIEVTTTTFGDDLPGDDYTLTVDQGAPSTIGINATLTLGSLSPGNHELSLGGVPANCTVADENPRMVAVTSGATTQTTFSVECVRLVYIAFERVSDRGDTDICLLDPNVGESSVQCITGGPGDTADDVHPAWFPQQERLIFASDRDGDFELYTMKVDGSDVTQLTQNDVYDGEPDLYFSGIKAVFTSERSGDKDIWEMDLTQPGNPVTQLTFDPASDYNPTFTWDHPTMRLFTSNRDGDTDIYRVDGPGNVSQQTIGNHNDDDAWWLPPNLYYSSTINGTWDVIRSPTGVPIEDFFAGNATEKQPAPGPDGWWVAVVSNKDGNFEIYKKNWSTLEVVRLTNNAASDTRPAWYAYWPPF